MHTLRDVDVWLAPNVPLALATALASHTGEEIAMKTDDVLSVNRHHHHHAIQLAFLSVVRSEYENGGKRASVLGKMDETVLRQVFAFTGPTAVRSVRADYVMSWVESDLFEYSE